MIVRRVWPYRPTFEGAFADFDQLRRDVLRLFDGVSGETPGAVGAGVFPPINITQDDDNFYVRAEVPGVSINDLSISALRNRVSISGKREIPHERERVSYHRKERPEGSFSRVITLPTEIDSSNVDARYTDGILVLSLPKVAEAKPRQITVKT